MMRINVIIPNMNGERLLPDCLDSLARQTRQPDEVIVVDNGSNDRSRLIVKEHHLMPRLLELPENRGFATAVNYGIQESAADVVALLNNDVVCDPRWIEMGEDALLQHPRADMAASLVLKSFSRDLIDSAGDMLTPDGRPAHVGGGRRAASFGQEILEVLSPCAGAAFYRKNMFSKTGCFEESFFAYLEDVDLGLRARSGGHRCIMSPFAVVYHHGAATELADRKADKRVDSAMRVRWIAANRVRVMARNLPASRIFLWGPCIAAGFIRSAAYHVTVSRQAKPFWQGIREGFARWGDDRRYFKKTDHGAFFDTESLIKEGFRPWQG